MNAEVTVSDCWRQYVPKPLLSDEPARRAFLRDVVTVARRNGYTGRARFATVTATGAPFTTPLYLIEVLP